MEDPPGRGSPISRFESYDASAAAKQAVAREALACGLADGTCVVSTQVLCEFYVVVTQKISARMSADEARTLIDLLAAMHVVETDVPLIRRAIDTQQRHRLPFWDALIVAAAERAGCERILSEDLGSGQTYGSVTVENPFP